MVVRIVPNDRSAPVDKLADAEIVFEGGLLTGMKLVGFSIWRNHRRALYTVTFPARQFTVNGERRSYALLRPVAAGGSQEPLRLCILQAYAEYEQRFGVVGPRSDASAEAPPGEGMAETGIPGEGIGAQGTDGGGTTAEGPTREGPIRDGPTDDRPTDDGPTDGGPTDGGPTDGGPTDGGAVAGEQLASERMADEDTSREELTGDASTVRRAVEDRPLSG